VIGAMVVGLLGATGARLFTSLAWTWLTPLGAVVTMGLGWLLGRSETFEEETGRRNSASP